jgi:predicted RecA/RadA family phage recombinase
MRNKLIRGLGTRGLMVAGLLLFIGLVALAVVDWQAASVGGTVFVLFGTALSSGEDNSTRLFTGKYTHNAATVPGQVIVANSCVLVAVNTKAADAENVYIYKGKVCLPKEASLAVNFLDKVYWDATNECITTTATANTECGRCVEKALAADTTIWVHIEPRV